MQGVICGLGYCRFARYTHNKPKGCVQLLDARLHRATIEGMPGYRWERVGWGGMVGGWNGFWEAQQRSIEMKPQPGSAPLLTET